MKKLLIILSLFDCSVWSCRDFEHTDCPAVGYRIGNWGEYIRFGRIGIYYGYTEDGESDEEALYYWGI